MADLIGFFTVAISSIQLFRGRGLGGVKLMAGWKQWEKYFLTPNISAGTLPLKNEIFPA